MGLDSLAPGTSGPTDVVSQKVYIENTVLSNEIVPVQITVNKSFNKVAYAKLVFHDGSASERDFRLSNDDKFKPGKKIKIELGYHGEVETVFEGIIVKHAIKVRPQGSSLLIIEAKDEAIKLTLARKSAYYIDKTDSTIIEEAAGTIDNEVEATTLFHKQLVQFESTAWDFILTRAEANGMLVFTDDGKLIVKKPSTVLPAVTTATYGVNIWEFEAEMDARKQYKQVKSQAWDFSTQSLETSEAGEAVFSGIGNIESDELGEVLAAEIMLSHSGRLQATQLQDWSNAYAMRNQLTKAVGRVRITGNANVKPGTMITLAGVGERFNGNAFVTGILHHYEGHWQTDIQFGWRDDWFYKKEDVMDKPASGLLPGVNGLQIGKVVSTDDSEVGEYRVKVHIPTFTASNEGIWARVATLDAGQDRGTFFRPQQGDEVILGFLQDDPREPIILGYLHSKDNKASPFPEQQGELHYGFKTKEGLKLVFDDTHKTMKLVVPAGSGEKSLIINDTSGAFEMKDEHQNSIKMNAQGITIQAGSGNVTINGTMVRIN